MGRGTERGPLPHRAGQAHPAPHETIIERVPLKGLGANGFGRWLDGFRTLIAEGWDITIVVDRKNTHAVAFGYKPPRFTDGGRAGKPAP